MVKSYNEVEACIQEALGSLAPDEEFSIPELANKSGVPVRRLQNRLEGVPPRSTRIPVNLKLSPAEELVVCRYIDRLDHLGLCVRPQMLRNCANIILARSYKGDDNSPPTVSPKWTTRFLGCHPKYSVRKQKVTDPR